MENIKSKNWIIALIVGVIVLVVGFTLYRTYQYRQSDEYALKKLGYSDADVSEILKFDNTKVQTIIGLEYNQDMVNVFKSKYFILSNLNRYLSYKKEHDDVSIVDTIAIVNVNADKEFYNDVIKTDMEKGNLILVNKFNALDENYLPDDLVEMGLQYAFAGKKIRSEVNENFKNLVNSSKKEGLTILANSTFRDYAYQERLYNNYESNNGKKEADKFVARPGHSEHQTGLSIDVSTLKGSLDEFENTPEFAWLQENAYRYGFILRYPKGKENITGYNYEPWHYRYVGVDIAKEIYDLGITFDEYYAYYENK